MTSPTRYGPTFQINTTDLGYQLDAAFTALADGRFVATWIDYSATGGDVSGGAIRAQILTTEGSLSGPEFLVNTTTLGEQTEPVVTALADGRFVIAWTDASASGPDVSGTAIRAQTFNADGSRIGAEFPLNTTTLNDQSHPTLTALDDGRFVAVWRDESLSSGVDYHDAIRAQVFNSDGSKSGSEFRVDTLREFDPLAFSRYEEPFSVVALADGRFTVTWEQFVMQTTGIRSVNILSQTCSPDGDFSGTKTDTFGLHNWSGIPSPFSTVALADGRFVVAYPGIYYSGTPYPKDATYAEVRNADGSQSTGEFKVSEDLPNDLAMTALPDGRFVIVSVTLSSTLIQVFDADGVLSGKPFSASNATGLRSFAPLDLTLTTLADGRFVLGWTDPHLAFGVASPSSISGQIFDPRIAAVTLNGTIADDAFVGTVFADSLGGSFGDDSLTGAAGDDEIGGGFGNDSLQGGRGNDLLSGDDGNDSIYGGVGSDQLVGGNGNDQLNGGSFADVMIGGKGDDVYAVDLATDLVIELKKGGIDTVQTVALSLDLRLYLEVENATLLGSGALNLTGNAAGNVLTGNAGNNLISGLDGADQLIGMDGADTLLGGAGNDRIQGGLGLDSLTGGADSDTFIIATAAEAGLGKPKLGYVADRITDFTAGSDKIDLSLFMSGGGFIGAAPFHVAGTAEVKYDALNSLLTGDVDGNGTTDWYLLVNSPGGLSAVDFIF